VDPIVAVPTLMTRDSRMPSRISGNASGSSTDSRRWRALRQGPNQEKRFPGS